MFRRKLDGYIFVAPSRRKGKKYDVYKDMKYITSFGAKSYEQYFDKIGYYSTLNHLSKRRRDLYYARHGKTNNKTSARYFSNKYLW